MAIRLRRYRRARPDLLEHVVQYLLAPDAVSEVVADEIRPRLSPPEAGKAGSGPRSR